MNRLIPFALALALATPLAAQDAAPEAPGEDGPSLLDRGADLMLRGLLDQIQPNLDELQDDMAGLAAQLLPIFRQLTEEMGPAILDVAGQIDSLTYYEAPVIQPNGDIVLRRKPDAPAWVPPAERPDAAGTEPGTAL